MAKHPSTFPQSGHCIGQPQERSRRRTAWRYDQKHLAFRIEARTADPDATPLNVVRHGTGVTFCAQPLTLGRASKACGSRHSGPTATAQPMEIVVRVPARVAFVGSMAHGDLEADVIASALILATTDGRPDSGCRDQRNDAASATRIERDAR